MSDQELHKLGEVLRSAREARGVDLARVERDTKIRARYLGALESGEYRDLPGAVYTKGFLRNYASYLGLDPDYLIDLYRLESTTTLQERPSVPTPPRPIATRRARAFVITPGAVVAAILTVGVAIFAVYLVSEFMTFAGTPELRVTDPAGDLAGYDGRAYTFRGSTAANSQIRAETATRTTRTTADADGGFTVTVQLVPGANVVTLTATDPLTNRDSEPVRRTIIVGDDIPSPTPGSVLAMTAPEEGATFSGPIELSGTAPARSTVTVTATFVSPAAATIRVVTLAGQDVPLPTVEPTAPDPLTLTADGEGAFSGSLALLPGAWDLAVEGGPDEPIRRRVAVMPAPGLNGTLLVAGGQSYLEIDEDGVPKADVSGRNAQPGAQIPLAAQQALRIRVGNAGAVSLSINGVQLGAMGGSGAVVEWRITRI